MALGALLKDDLTSIVGSLPYNVRYPHDCNRRA